MLVYKYSENRKPDVSDVLIGYEYGTLAWNIFIKFHGNMYLKRTLLINYYFEEGAFKWV